MLCLSLYLVPAVDVIIYKEESAIHNFHHKLKSILQGKHQLRRKDKNNEDFIAFLDQYGGTSHHCSTRSTAKAGCISNACHIPVKYRLSSFTEQTRY